MARDRGPTLAAYARQCIRQELGGPKASSLEDSWAHERGATFVTLRWPSGTLQGCIGNLDFDRPIAVDVSQNAVAAATRDPRAKPLALADVDRLAVELSILSPLEAIRSEADIRVGIDGVVVSWHAQRATFLPAMWREMPDLRIFMRELAHKAGLPSHVDHNELTLHRYTVERYVDPSP